MSILGNGYVRTGWLTTSDQSDWGFWCFGLFSVLLWTQCTLFLGWMRSLEFVELDIVCGASCTVENDLSLLLVVLGISINLMLSIKFSDPDFGTRI